MEKNNIEPLAALLKAYSEAPEIYQAGRYWKSYEDKIISEIKEADFEQLRRGKYPIFGTFGFSESIYHYQPQMPFYLKTVKKIIRKLFITNRSFLPYSLKLSDIREMAYQNCLLQGQLANIRSIAEIEVSDFGNPNDIFVIKGKKYTMQFLNFYIRICYAQKYLQLKGHKTIVELGSGSGFQVEILKKIFPDLTILCFDLPYTLFLCEQYLSKSLGEQSIVTSDKTLTFGDMIQIQKGKVYFFGNWKFALLSSFQFDVFWNAASFGEMEPSIVKNYLTQVVNNCRFIYLLQARNGKESAEKSGVVTPIRFADYNEMLEDFDLLGSADAYEANQRMSQSGGYFQAVWQNRVAQLNSQ